MKKIILALSILFACLIGFLFLRTDGNPKAVHAQELFSDVVFGALQAEVDKLPDDAGALIILPGKTFEKNSNQQLPSFSVIKLWIAATAYDLSAQGQFPINPRTALLIESMLENSDNSATNALIDELGGFDVVNNFISSRYGNTFLGRKMLEAPSAGGDNLSSPADSVAFMQNLVGGNLAGSDDITAILRNRTSTGSDPYKPSASLPATADFIGKSGILGEGRNEVGSFLGENGNRVFFAIFLPSGGAKSEALISKIEQLAYNPTAPLTNPTGTGVAVTGKGTLKGSRVCVKVGATTDPMPDICNTPVFGGSTPGSPGVGGLSGCPVPGREGHIKTGSYYSGLGTSGHCNVASGYTSPCSIPDPQSRRSKSIDVPMSPGEYTVLPTINGQVLQWKYLTNYDDTFGGLGHVFRATDSAGDNWDLQLLHQQPTSLVSGQSYPSGTQVSTTSIDHAHVTIGKNILYPEKNCLDSTDPNVCNVVDPGWLNADTDMGMCM